LHNFTATLVAISNSTLLRNPKFIADASYSSGTVTVRTELPHNLKVGEEVEIVNISPSGYNGTYTVTSVPSAKEFTYTATTALGVFASDTSNRTTSLPYFRRKRYSKTYQVYRTQVVQPYIANIQDGVYYLTLVNHSNNPTVTPFREQSFAQPVENLYPQSNNDNPDSDPDAANSHALPGIIGKVVVNDPQKSITKETLESFVVGYGITNIQSSSGTAHTIYTAVDHGLSGITTVSIVSAGSNYGSSGSFSGNLYNARLVGFAGSTTGSNATARITVTSGAITGVQIIDGGSAYGIGNTLPNSKLDISGSVSASTVSATTATFTGNVSIGGTLTYEDVTNIDSLGIVTARTGIRVLAGGINAVGVVTATTFSGSGANLTSVPYSVLTGISTSIVGDTNPRLGTNLDINGKYITGTGGDQYYWNRNSICIY